MAILSIINGGLIFVGIAFAILSITGNYWLSCSSSHRGLWFNCTKGCEKIHNKKAVFLAIGLTVYTRETNQNKALNLSWSYYIGWCSFGISIISAIICFVTKKNSQSTYTPF